MASLRSAQYEDLLSTAPGVIYQRIRRADGRIEYTYLSDGLRALCGLEPAAVVANADLLLDILHPGDRDRFFASLEESVQKAEPWELEFRIIATDGVEKWVRATTTTRRHDNGDVVWNGLLQEVTDHKLLQVETAKQNATINAIFANMDQGLVYYDRDLIVVAHNTQVLEMLGLPLDGFGNNEPFETWLRYSARESGNHSGKSIEERIARRMDIARKFEPYNEDLIRSDGATIEVRGRVTSDGGFVLTYTDVSERKQLEDQLRQHGEQLVDKSEQLSQQLDKSRSLAHALDRRNKELSDSQKASEFLANHDALTGLPNRRLLLETLANAVEAAGKSDIRLALLFVDLDNFKAINDAYGHGAGDEVLVEAARRLRSGIRQGDIVARLGGDEFAVFIASVPKDGTATVVELADRLRAALRISPKNTDGLIETSACVGVAFFPGKAATTDGFLRLADEAMYEAKRRGRNAVVVAD